MITSVLAILTALVPFVIWLWKRRAAKAADPITQQENRHEQTDKEIIQRDAEAINRSLDDDLQRLHALQGHQPGEGGSAVDGGQDVHAGG